MRRIVSIALLAFCPMVAKAQAPQATPAGVLVADRVVDTNTVVVQATPAVDPTARRHLGLLLRLDAGFGLMGMKGTSPAYIDVWDQTQEALKDGIKGFDIPFGFTAGYAVIENFIIGAEVWGLTTTSPNSQHPLYYYSNMTQGSVGLHLTYYFMPVNIYVSATPSIAIARLAYWSRDYWVPALGSFGTRSYSTNVGFGGKFAVGKEWWVGDHWGVGVALQFLMGIYSDKYSYTWTTLSGAAAFSVTYN